MLIGNRDHARGDTIRHASDRVFHRSIVRSELMRAADNGHTRQRRAAETYGRSLLPRSTLLTTSKRCGSRSAHSPSSRTHAAERAYHSCTGRHV